MVHIADRLTERRQLVDVARLVEGTVLAVCLAAASLAALLAPPFEAVAAAAMLCLPLPMLLWAAARFGVVGSSAAVLLFGVFAVSGALTGAGPFTAQAGCAQRPVRGAVPGRHLHTAAAARRRARRTPLARERARRQRCAARRGTGVDSGPDRDSRELRPHRRCQRIMAPARRAHPRRAFRQPQGRRKSPASLLRTGARKATPLRRAWATAPTR